MHNIKFTSNSGGPLYYLGNRYLNLPDLSGHMMVDHRWLLDIFSVIFFNSKGKKYFRCFEPFAGSASWSLAAMELGLAEEYIINDSDSILINTHRLMRDNPDNIKRVYSDLTKSYSQTSSKKDFFIKTIEAYNKEDDSDQKSFLLPFIINHSWSGIIFHDSKGNIIYHENNINGKIIPGYLNEANLSLDMYFKEVDRVTNLFYSNKVNFQSGDFLQAMASIQPGDFAALNPPYPENERSLTEMTAMYTELYLPEMLHENIVKTIQKMENNCIDYFMTYGFYNPNMKKFVIRDRAGKIKNYFRVLGYPDCAFGMALDQMYFNSRFSIPNNLNDKILYAFDVIGDREISSKEAIDRFIELSKTNI